MALRRAPSAFLCRFSADSTPARPRRVLAAFMLGAAISAAGIGALASNFAGARGAFTALASAPEQPGRYYEATYAVAPLVAGAGPRFALDEGPARRHKHRHANGNGARGQGASSGAQPVCVRLCDGFFFPLTVAAGDVASQTAACNSQCPDAPTEVYYRNGADEIGDAISSKGQRYSALPVALRYRKTTDNTCSCHRDVVAYAPLRDPSLRRGDAIMTPAGMVVFSGAEGAEHRASDFSALATAPMTPDRRSALQAMERVSVLTGRPTLKDWLTAQTGPKPRTVAQAQPERVARVEDKIHLLVWRGGEAD